MPEFLPSNDKLRYLLLKLLRLKKLLYLIKQYIFLSLKQQKFSKILIDFVMSKKINKYQKKKA